MKDALRSGLGIAFEGEGTEELPYDAESAAVDVTTARQDYEVSAAELSQLDDAATSLETLYNELTALRGIGLESDSVPYTQIVMERVERLSGLRYSGESFRANSAIGLVVTLEGLGEMITQMWEKFKAAWRKTVSAFRQLLRKFIAYFKGGQKAEATLKKAEAMQDVKTEVKLDNDRIRKIVSFNLTNGTTYAQSMSNAAANFPKSAKEMLGISQQLAKQLEAGKSRFEEVLAEYVKNEGAAATVGEYLHTVDNPFIHAGDHWVTLNADKSSAKLGPLSNGLTFEVSLKYAALSTFFDEAADRKTLESIPVGVPQTIKTSLKGLINARQQLVADLEKVDALLSKFDNARYYENFERAIEELGDTAGPKFRANFGKFMQGQRATLNILQNAMAKALVEEIRNVDAMVNALAKALEVAGEGTEA